MLTCTSNSSLKKRDAWSPSLEGFTSIIPFSQSFETAFSDFLKDWFEAFRDYGAEVFTEDLDDILCVESLSLGELYIWLTSGRCPLREAELKSIQELFHSVTQPFGSEVSRLAYGKLCLMAFFGSNGFELCTMHRLDPAWYTQARLLRQELVAYDRRYHFLSTAAKKELGLVGKPQGQGKEVTICPCQAA